MNTPPTNLQTLPKIQVVIRKRPLSKKESLKHDLDIIEIKNKKTVIVKEIKTKLNLERYIEEHTFTYDAAYDETYSNELIYLETIRPMIQCAFYLKSKVTCFAFGQTGSGKTYTMMGEGLSMNDIKTPGIYLFAAYDIFTILQSDPSFYNYTITTSFYEIYCGKLYDLLNDRKVLTAREDGKQNICIVGLMEKKVDNLKSLMGLIEYGIKMRTVGITGANADSSRSHGIIQIKILNDKKEQSGKITLIDLAGSEREAEKVDINKKTRIDGAEINKSLLALKECFRALEMERKHTPFRGSKLTLVLRDSFIGNCKTLMIANISPSSMSADHTLNTLRYADRVKELKSHDIAIGNGNNNLNYRNNNIKDNKPERDIHEMIGGLLGMSKPIISQEKDNNEKGIDIEINDNGNVNGINNEKENRKVKKQVIMFRNKSSVGSNRSYNEMACKEKQDDVNVLTEMHEKILKNIMEQEQICINSHREHVGEMSNIIQYEMRVIEEAEQPNYNILKYVNTMRDLFKSQSELIRVISEKFENFQQMLLKEDEISRLKEEYQKRENNSCLDIIDNSINDDEFIEESLHM